MLSLCKRTVSLFLITTYVPLQWLHPQLPQWYYPSGMGIYQIGIHVSSTCWLILGNIVLLQLLVFIRSEAFVGLLLWTAYLGPYQNTWGTLQHLYICEYTKLISYIIVVEFKIWLIPSECLSNFENMQISGAWRVTSLMGRFPQSWGAW